MLFSEFLMWLEYASNHFSITGKFSSLHFVSSLMFFRDFSMICSALPNSPCLCTYNCFTMSYPSWVVNTPVAVLIKLSHKFVLFVNLIGVNISCERELSGLNKFYLILIASQFSCKKLNSVVYPDEPPVNGHFKISVKAFRKLNLPESILKIKKMSFSVKLAFCSKIVIFNKRRIFSRWFGQPARVFSK